MTDAGKRYEALNSSAPLDEYRGPNDFSLKKLIITAPNGESFDIRNLFSAINIYQDLFSNTMSAELVLVDALNVKRHLPIIGQQEKVDIEFETPGFGLSSYTFFVYAMPVRTVANLARNQMYVLKMVSAEAYVDTMIKFSKSMYGPTDSLIQTVFNEYLSIAKKPLNIKTPTINNQKIVVPYWSPFQTINWLSSRAIPRTNKNACNYVFFEKHNTDSGKQEYCFTTIESLVSVRDPVMSYTYRPQRLRDSPRSPKDTSYDFTNIYSIKFEEEGDRISEIISGRFSGNILTHDIVTQEYSKNILNYKDEFNLTQHVELYYPISRERDTFSNFYFSNYMYKPKHSFMHDELEDNDHYELWSLKRKSLLKSILSKKVLIEVPGDSRLTVGDVVHLDIPNIKAINTQDEDIDPMDSGRYLVIEVNHQINLDAFTTHLKLVRDSSTIPIADINKGS